MSDVLFVAGRGICQQQMMGICRLFVIDGYFVDKLQILEKNPFSSYQANQLETSVC